MHLKKDCLQALYQAQTPRWRYTCNVILLDEMNLSRSEQYFSEFLSALEKNGHGESLISLAEISLPNAPKGLKEYHQILVPLNVWFIGTANHDEATNELAEKAYESRPCYDSAEAGQSFQTYQIRFNKLSFRSVQKVFQHAC